MIDWSCYATLHQSDFGDKDAGVDPQLPYKNLANAVILRPKPADEPVLKNDSCITTLYTNDGCESNHFYGVDEKYQMTDDQVIGFVSNTVEFAPRSVLMTEQSELKLYSEARFAGGFMRAENMFYYDEEVDHCVCVKLTNDNGDAYPINSLKYTKFNDSAFRG